MAPQTDRSSAQPWVLLFVAVCLVASNMRMSITGLGPILEDIAADQGVNAATLGALASLPLVVWALVSPLTHLVSNRLGATNTVTCALVLLMLGTLWRSLPGTVVNLWTGTVVIGVALAIANVLMPAVIKRDFGQRVPLVMGVYTVFLGGMGAVGPGIVVPVSKFTTDTGTFGWRVALLSTGFLIPAALLLWLFATRHSRAPESPRQSVAAADTAVHTVELGGEILPDSTLTSPPRLPGSMGRRIWRDPLAWWLAIYMGTQSAVFFTLVAWLAPIGVSLGHSQAHAGFDVMYLQIVGVLGAAIVGPLLHGKLKRVLPVLVPALSVTGALGMLAAPSLMLVWVTVNGFACGAAMSVALTLIAIRARDHLTATVLSGMVQSVGYLVAAVGPFLFGALFEINGSWTMPLIALATIALIQAVSGVIVGADRYVLEPLRRAA